MNIPLLQKHISAYKKHLHEDREKHVHDLAERKQRTEYYQAFTVICAPVVEGMEAMR